MDISFVSKTRTYKNQAHGQKSQRIIMLRSHLRLAHHAQSVAQPKLSEVDF